MSECDRTVETLETRIVELESALSVAERDIANKQVEISDLKTDLAEAMGKLRLGLALAQDLIKRLDIMEEHDAQRERLRDWAGGPEIPE